MVTQEIVQSLQTWLDSMPPRIRNMPMVGVIVDGRQQTLTPAQLVSEVKRDTDLGKELAQVVIQRGVEALRG